MPVEDGCGVYFLIRASSITYVGKTTSLLQRLHKHHRSGRKFDSFSFIACSPEHLDELESIYIALLLPQENSML